MTPAQVKEAKLFYVESFNEDLPRYALDLMEDINDLDDLIAVEDELTNGQYDAIDWALYKA